MTNYYNCESCLKVFRRTQSDPRIACPWCGGIAKLGTGTEMDVPKFTTEHYVSIASTLNDHYHDNSYTKGAIRHVSMILIDLFSSDNPNFDEDLFLTAIETEPPKEEV